MPSCYVNILECTKIKLLLDSQTTYLSKYSSNNVRETIPKKNEKEKN